MKAVCLDLETNGLNSFIQAETPWAKHPSGCRVCGVAMYDGVVAEYSPVRHTRGKNLDLDTVLDRVQGIFDDPDTIVFGHNFKFDLRFLAAEGITVKGPVFDTAALARLVDNTHYGVSLEGLCKFYGIEGKKTAIIESYLRPKDRTFADVPIDIMQEYAKQDVLSTWFLAHKLLYLLPEECRDLWEIEKEFTLLLFQAEMRGVKVNEDLILRDRLGALEKLMEVRDELSRIAGWDVDPSRTLHKNELLVDQFGFKPTVFTPKTHKPKWSKDVLENLEIPDSPEAQKVGHLFRDWNRLSSFESTYLEGWQARVDKNGYLHSDWRQFGTRTGRLAGRDPNLQNVPKSARRYIIPPKGKYIVGFDWSQIEYRMFGHYTKDPTIFGTYRDNPFADFHQATGDLLAVPRDLGKMLNFAFLYGMGKAKLLLALRQALTLLPNRDEIIAKLEGIVGHKLKNLKQAADAVYNLYHLRFPSIRTFGRSVGNVAKTRGYIKGLYGRRWLFSPKAAVRESTHKAVNYLIQGSCGDLLRYKLIEAEKTIVPHFDAEFVITVHDSLYYYVAEKDVPEFYSLLKACLEDVPELSLPVIADGQVALHSLDSYIEPGAGVTDADFALLDCAKFNHAGALETAEGYALSSSGL